MSGSSQNGDQPVRGDATRDMAGHLLFEISTEVANRGMFERERGVCIVLEDED